MSAVKWIVLAGAGLYVGIGALLYFTQRALMYFPQAERTPPTDAGFGEAAEIALETADGERLIAWHVPPRHGRPTVVYLHGNGGALRHRVPRWRSIIAQGTGLLALSYRGYGGSSGKPSEAGLIADAHAAYDFAKRKYGAERLVLWGESLGTGVAIALAADRNVARIILEAPFTSTADIARRVYPIYPVWLLMRDQYRSDERIARVTAPILVLHGERDNVVPIELGERLYALATSRKRMIRFPLGGHADLGAHGADAEARAFINELAE
ncbi:MAG: alpha/beta fold hydrolase [Proteobacteria bacterium]|nr:alpha/beta fold hydrolase [Pseudomonadota bacterium]